MPKISGKLELLFLNLSVTLLQLSWMMNLIYLKLLTGTVVGGREEKNVFQFLYEMFDFSLAVWGQMWGRACSSARTSLTCGWVAGAHSGVPNLGSLALELQCDCWGTHHGNKSGPSMPSTVPLGDKDNPSAWNNARLSWGRLHRKENLVNILYPLVSWGSEQGHFGQYLVIWEIELWSLCHR